MWKIRCVYLDVLPGDLLAEEDDLAPPLHRRGVVRHVHDGQLLLGLGVIHGHRAYRLQHHAVLPGLARVLQEGLNTRDIYCKSKKCINVIVH